mmetsp:Transcript_11150/g.22500  ORF Transcript_11150/g.22500 Transcript_11150/m.22500 type:complete len:230 (+) Transcript_11150:348-1037(+)
MSLGCRPQWFNTPLTCSSNDSRSSCAAACRRRRHIGVSSRRTRTGGASTMPRSPLRRKRRVPLVPAPRSERRRLSPRLRSSCSVDLPRRHATAASHIRGTGSASMAAGAASAPTHSLKGRRCARSIARAAQVLGRSPTCSKRHRSPSASRMTRRVKMKRRMSPLLRTFAAALARRAATRQVRAKALSLRVTAPCDARCTLRLYASPLARGGSSRLLIVARRAYASSAVR